ncbi:uncharacterized protein TNCV_4276141 [Trichonephila clavipes]|nr:uncharacterized protein TNCV_4276141 [Trichonephila clavipes]
MNRGKKLSDGKSISGKNRLTDKFIDTITTYYGNAIRQNNSSVSDMRQAIWAIYCHYRSTDEEPMHHFCPIGDTSWSKYQKAWLATLTATLNSRRAESPLVRLVAEDKRWEVLTLPQGILPQNWSGTELNRTVTCRVLKATANDSRTSIPCHDEFRGPRSDYVRQVSLATTTILKIRGHEATPLMMQGDIEDVFSELDNGG